MRGEASDEGNAKVFGEGQSRQNGAPLDQGGYHCAVSRLSRLRRDEGQRDQVAVAVGRFCFPIPSSSDGSSPEQAVLSSSASSLSYRPEQSVDEIAGRDDACCGKW